ncbi:MAG TPA: tetratricopeptide repeat protein [Bryobacteraceae bacterium]|nr:tetratricopeptide repeat protein [Bryobacteraceae bacterium]
MNSPRANVRLAVTILLAALASGMDAARLPDLADARQLYQKTDYSGSLKLLLAAPSKDAAAWQLIGQNYFMLAEYKKATEALEKAAQLGAGGSDFYVWLGRSYGRRAETAGPFTAPGLASHARKMFEKAVELDIRNREATGDLLDYYLGAPGFLGGGLNKAEDLAQKVVAVDPPEGHYLLAQVEDKRKHYESAEQHLRQALALAPRQVNRITDLAKYLAKRGQMEESDQLFAQAADLAPRDPEVMYYRAETYIDARRHLDDARQLLRQYLASPLTPNDPPRSSAEALLKKAGH